MRLAGFVTLAIVASGHTQPVPRGGANMAPIDYARTHEFRRMFNPMSASWLPAISRPSSAGRWLLALFAVISLSSHAQFAPKVYAAGPKRGDVVDADSAAPLAGVVIVARWEWLEFRWSHSGGSYDNNGQSVHLGEATSDNAGRFRIPAWGPVTKVRGMMDSQAPLLLAFKPGYEPLVHDIGDSKGTTLRLKKFAGEPKAYAKLVAAFQGSLRWDWEENSEGFPTMVSALHRERVRLGSEGAVIRGADRMPGRSGEGKLIDVETLKSGTGGVAWVEWTMRRVEGGADRRKVVQAVGSRFQPNAVFYVSPWRLPGPRVRGWEIDTAVKPLVRIYPHGGERSAAVRWEEKGGAISVRRTPDTRAARVAELRKWRNDIDAELAKGDRVESMELLQPLLDSFDDQCRALTPDLHKELCFDPGSDVGRAIYASTHRTERIEEGENGLRIVTRTPAPEPTPAPAGPPPIRGVKGFSIEPSK
ncbi:MAG: hypothetical protein ABI885_11325 [Gammaproteobacteria bacterium]